MRQLHIKSIFPSVTGACFIVGLFVATQLFYGCNKSKDHIYVDRPSGFEFRNHKIVSGQEKFTVEGELINKQENEWENVQLVVSIYAGDAYMTYCRGSLDYIGKRSNRAFRLVCRETAGSNLPGNITYELVVKRAARH